MLGNYHDYYNKNQEDLNVVTIKTNYTIFQSIKRNVLTLHSDTCIYYMDNFTKSSNKKHMQTMKH